MAAIDELRKARLRKLEELRKKGIDPYPAAIKRGQRLADAKKMAGREVAVAGRLMAIRGQGKISFADIFDGSGKIQIVFKSDLLPVSSVELLPLTDIGDFISFHGKVGKTQTVKN